MALVIKTKTVGKFDFTKADISELIPVYSVDEKQLETDINRILKSHGKKVEATDVADGDMVTVNCQSDIPKFNKAGIIVLVGKGLFSNELEEQLIGKDVGDGFTATVDEKEVAVTIVKSSRTILPELTDENVSGFGMDGITSVLDLKRLCIDKQLDRLLDDFEPLDGASAKIWEQLGNEIAVEFDPEEEAFAVEKANRQLVEINERMAMLSEEEKAAYEEEYEEEFGEDRNEIDMEAFVRNMYINEVRLAAYGYSQVKGTDAELTEEQYEAKIDKWMVYHEGMSRDEVKALHTQMDFLIDGYSEMVCKEIDKYTLECFKNKMNPLR